MALSETVDTGAPSPAMLSRTVDALFLNKEAATEEYRSLLKRYPVAVLRCLLERRDARLLAKALRSGSFSPELTSRAAAENANLPYSMCLLLNFPALSEEIPPPLSGSALQEDNEADADLLALEQLDRWRFEAVVAFPFLRRATLDMPCVSDGAIDPFGTDGLAFYARPAAGRELRYEDFLHMLLHCVFRHTSPPERAQRSLWDLACDLSCEYLRSELFPGTGEDMRLSAADILPEGVDPRSALSAYHGLMELFEEDLIPLRERFVRDDHRYWYESPAASPQELSRGNGGKGGTAAGFPGAEGAASELRRELLEHKWKEIAEQLERGRKKPSRFGLAPGSREEKMLLRKDEKYSFSRYLQRFFVTREELQLDEGSFDYIPYYYGLERYGNLPFLEPLEYTESRRIQQLVIAIDTSGSCSREMVERFLAVIRRILMQRENFFRKMDIHIIQCDAAVRDHVEIHSPEDWLRYLTHLTIKGRGGTSFVPVFRLIEKLQGQGKLKELKGLLYFTDGDGIYPKKAPPYEVAFIFPDRERMSRPLPDWITPLCLND